MGLPPTVGLSGGDVLGEAHFKRRKMMKRAALERARKAIEQAAGGRQQSFEGFEPHREQVVQSLVQFRRSFDERERKIRRRSMQKLKLMRAFAAASIVAQGASAHAQKKLRWMMNNLRQNSAYAEAYLLPKTKKKKDKKKKKKKGKAAKDGATKKGAADVAGKAEPRPMTPKSLERSKRSKSKYSRRSDRYG